MGLPREINRVEINIGRDKQKLVNGYLKNIDSNNEPEGWRKM